MCSRPPCSTRDAVRERHWRRLTGALPERVAALDISSEAVEFTARRFPSAEVCAGVGLRASLSPTTPSTWSSASRFSSTCAILRRRFRELARVSAGSVVVSVPHEPWFRVGSLIRGKYVRTLGNHPEHINHWNPRTLATAARDPVRGGQPGPLASLADRPLPAPLTGRVGAGADDAVDLGLVGAGARALAANEDQHLAQQSQRQQLDPDDDQQHSEEEQGSLSDRLAADLEDRQVDGDRQPDDRQRQARALRRGEAGGSGSARGR